jgi:hypothetical protein
MKGSECMGVCVRVCLCVCVRERETQGGGWRARQRETAAESGLAGHNTSLSK